ncbi:MAG: disulfide bond formation protein B [Pseudomonadota bacterium]
MTRRLANFATFAACAAMMAFALYSEHVLGLYPCPLCIFQRLAVIVMGLVALVAAVHNPAGVGRMVYTVLGVVVGGLGIAVAGRHVWLQNLPPDQVPACGGASLDYLLETLPLFDALNQVLNASGECAEVSWRFLGLTMPTWVLVALSVLSVWIVLSNWRLPARRAAADSI